MTLPPTSLPRTPPSHLPTPPPTQRRSDPSHARSSSPQTPTRDHSHLPRWQTRRASPDYLEKEGVPAIIHHAALPDSPISYEESNTMPYTGDDPTQGGLYWAEMEKMNQEDDGDTWKATVKGLKVPLRLKVLRSEDLLVYRHGKEAEVPVDEPLFLPHESPLRFEEEGEDELDMMDFVDFEAGTKDEEVEDDDDEIVLLPGPPGALVTRPPHNATRTNTTSASSSLTVSRRRARSPSPTVDGDDSSDVEFTGRTLSSRKRPRLQAEPIVVDEEGTPLREVSAEEGGACAACGRGCGCRATAPAVVGRRGAGSGSKTLSNAIRGNILQLLLGEETLWEQLRRTHSRSLSMAEVAVLAGARPEEGDRVRFAARWMQDALPRMMREGRL